MPSLKSLSKCYVFSHVILDRLLSISSNIRPQTLCPLQGKITIVDVVVPFCQKRQRDVCQFLRSQNILKSATNASDHARVILAVLNPITVKLESSRE
jgi:hypothetical protein